MITLNNIKKTFKVRRREGGMRNAVKSFFAREYDTVEALAGISFSVGDGEIVGYIGPNGAGKSSTIKVMSGILTPDSGECVIDGLTPWKHRREHVSRLGVVFGQRSALWWDVPVADSFLLLRDIYSVPQSDYEGNLKKLTEMLDLGDLMGTPTRQLSLGQRMRCEIAAALIHSPDILFLDEPTIGLDAPSKLAVREFVSELNRERGTTVILTTHDMQDIEALAERIILIGKGRILLDGSLNDIRHRFELKRRVAVDFSGGLDCTHLPNGIGELTLDGAPLSHAVTGGTHRLEASAEAGAVSELLSYLTSNVEVRDISVTTAPIDEIVANMYKEYRI